MRLNLPLRLNSSSASRITCFSNLDSYPPSRLAVRYKFKSKLFSSSFILSWRRTSAPGFTECEAFFRPWPSRSPPAYALNCIPVILRPLSGIYLFSFCTTPVRVNKSEMSWPLIF